MTVRIFLEQLYIGQFYLLVHHSGNASKCQQIPAHWMKNWMKKVVKLLLGLVNGSGILFFNFERSSVGNTAG